MPKNLPPPRDSARRLNFRKPDAAKSVENVAAKCGHIVRLEFEPGAKFIVQTIAKARRRACKSCRAAIEQANRDAAAKRRAERERFPRGKPRPRLPHGSRFEATYDAAKQTWSGTLVVPGDLTPCGLIVASGAPGVFKLLEQLDDRYRELAPAAAT